MQTKVYADELIKTHGLTEAIRIISGINTKTLRGSQDLTYVNKKKNTVLLTDNKRTSGFFESVLGYLLNKEKKK